MTVTVTEDAPGYEGKYLWNYHVHNDAFQHGPGNWLGMFAVDLSYQDFQNSLGMGNIGNNMGWGTVETLDPAELAWQAGEFNPQIEIGQSGDFWFTTPPTAVLMSDGYVSDTGFAFQADGPVVAPAPALVVTTADDVVNPNDDAMGVYSLRELVNYVNNETISRPGGQWRIKFKSTLAGATITLNPNPPDYGQFTLQKNVFIDGENQGITIRRDPGTAVKHRIFEVLPGTNARLKDLTIRNGDLNQVLAHGGAVYSFGNLTVENCTFAQNRTNNDGGAIAAQGGTLSVIGSTFTGNSASDGGAIYVNIGVTATITSSTLALNTATDQGGGVYILMGTVTLNGTDVNGNSAVNAGGGIHVSSQGSGGSTLTLTGGTTIQNNLVTSASGQGGGIYFGKGTINLNGVWIGSNTATQGDGMYRVNGTTKNIGNPGVTWFDDQEFVGP